MLTRLELLALVTFAARPADVRVRYAIDNSTATDTLVRKALITIGEPSAGASRTAIPHVTERGDALIEFMCALRLPVAKTIWEIPAP